MKNRNTITTIPMTTSQNPTNDELEIDILDDPYPWASGPDEIRRCFILEHFNWNPDIHVDAQIQQLKSIERFIIGHQSDKGN